jgi:hypothetical protein
MGGSVQKVLALAKSFLDQRIPAMTSPVREKKTNVPKFSTTSNLAIGLKTHWL